MLFLVDALDMFVTVAIIATFITQVVWPVMTDQPTFPAYRKWRARRYACKATVVPMPPPQPDPEPEKRHDDDAA